MRGSIDFHHKTHPDTRKVGNIRSDRMLPAKARFDESGRAQIAPQNRFRMAHPCSEFFCELLRAQFVFAKLPRHGSPPPPPPAPPPPPTGAVDIWFSPPLCATIPGAQRESCGNPIQSSLTCSLAA